MTKSAMSPYGVNRSNEVAISRRGAQQTNDNSESNAAGMIKCALGFNILVQCWSNDPLGVEHLGAGSEG